MALDGSLSLGGFLAYLDPGHLPKECAILGDLAQKTANLSYGLLIKQGADASERRIWQVLIEVFSDFTHVPTAAIDRDTRFLANTPGKAKAA